jgi:cytochrome c oxidase subunit 4
MADPQHDASSGPNLQTYFAVFGALCVCTALSFVANWLMGQTVGSMMIILFVAVIKAALVAAIFMHLKFDWSRLYFLIFPVAILAVMMMIVLLPDIVMGKNFNR